ncbi:MAG: hypothetical protein WB870_12705 [Gallionellaceae bacterium]
MKRAVALNPSNINFRFFLGLLFDYSGESEAAAEHFSMVENGQALLRTRLDAWRYIQAADKDSPRITGSWMQTFKLGMDAAISNRSWRPGPFYKHRLRHLQLDPNRS